jgi:hypothetical protein
MAVSPEMTVSPESTSPEMALPRCLHCGHEAHWLGDHLAEVHGQTVGEYLDMFPGATTASEAAVAAFEKVSGGSRRVAPKPEDLRVSVLSYDRAPDIGVSEDMCLRMPRHWRWPKANSNARSAMEDAFLDLLVVDPENPPNVWVWGLPGTSKDSSIKALCASLRIPSLFVQIVPGRDLSPLFYQLELRDGETTYQYGELWKAATQGVEGTDGVRRPVLILLSDFDRADPAQVEWFRALLEEDGRINGPDGRVHELFPGTRFVATANTNGSGDERGRMVSAGALDSSILDRFETAVEYTYMPWSDESAILRAKFPLVAEKIPDVLDSVGKATKALRRAIERGNLYAEFSHRAVCAVIGRAERILKTTDWSDGCEKRMWNAWMSKLDSTSRNQAWTLVNSSSNEDLADEVSDRV